MYALSFQRVVILGLQSGASQSLPLLQRRNDLRSDDDVNKTIFQEEEPRKSRF